MNANAAAARVADRRQRVDNPRAASAVRGNDDLFGEAAASDPERCAGRGDAGTAGFRDPAFMANRTAPVHRWVPWIAGYSKHFVADALARFATRPSVVLDPFSGVGTTLVEADLAGHEALGFEINPYAAFASKTKLKAHRVSSEALRDAANELRAYSERVLAGGVAPVRTIRLGTAKRAPSEGGGTGA